MSIHVLQAPTGRYRWHVVERHDPWSLGELIDTITGADAFERVMDYAREYDQQWEPGTGI